MSQRLVLISGLALAVVCLAVFAAASLLAGSGPRAGRASAASPTALRIDMRVLLITDTTTEPSFTDWQNTLKREGVPFDTLVTGTTSSLPASALSTTAPDGASEAKYEGVVVANGGSEGLSTAEWTTLETFEQNFYVRQITAYTSGNSSYGLTDPDPSGGGALDGQSATLTTAGKVVFPYLVGTVPFDTGSYGYASTPAPATGTTFDTLLTGPNNSAALGIYTTADGRQDMVQTFDENQYMTQSELLRHGELAWLTRNTYLGDQRNYFEAHIDDNFLADAAWSIAGNATTAAHSTDFNDANALREVPADVTAAAAWSTQNNLRLDMLFNGGGSVAVASGDSLVGAGDSGGGTTGSSGTTGGTGSCTSATPCPDPLLAAFQATDPTTNKPYTAGFGWISHSWDHPNVDQGCATQNYIEAELNQNTAWATKAPGSTPGDPVNGGLGLTSSTDPGTTLGTDNPQVAITGEHSGLANLLPGNPGQVDPPSLDEAVAATTTGTLATGSYVYAVTDQFNTAAPTATAVPAAGESAASVSSAVALSAPGSVTLTWGAVCHAGQYNVYRAPDTAGTIGAWTLIGKAAANPSTDFLNPSGGSTTNTAGGGAGAKTFVDTGTAGTLTGSSGALTATSTPSDEGHAVESAYEQNPALDAAFAATTGGGIKYFGSDASKPYPNPSDGAFATGTYSGSEFASGTGFSDAGATGIARYPTNIYYNVSTNAQEIDEYQTLYDSPSCTAVTGVTSCNPAGTRFTIGQIAANADQEMFQHMMGNDPRPHYFHQTNLMSQTTGTVNGVGDGLFYEVMNPLLAQYHQDFAANTPIEQLTMPQIGALLNEQDSWAQANAGQVTGFIEGNEVTVDNTGAATEMPLTGTTVGSAYAGGQSGWVLAPAGTSTYTALATWPAPPAPPATTTTTGAPVATTPTEPAPDAPTPHLGPTSLPGPVKLPATPASRKTATQQASVCIQVPPVIVHVKHATTVTMHLKCKAAMLSSFCAGKITLTVKRQTVSKTFRIKTRRMATITVRLPKRARAAASGKQRRTLHATLRIVTRQARGRPYTSPGNLIIKT